MKLLSASVLHSLATGKQNPDSLCTMFVVFRVTLMVLRKVKMCLSVYILCAVPHDCIFVC